jgi:hypothetical protein
MRKHEGLQLCYCTYYSCQGKPVSAEEWLIHNELSDAIQLQALESAVAQVALIDEQPLSRKTTVAGSSHSSNTLHSSSPPIFCTPASGPGKVQPLSVPTGHTQSSSLPPQTSKAKEVYRELYRLDTTMHNHLQIIAMVLEEWSHGNKFTASLKSTLRFLTRKEAQQFLLVEASWLREAVARIRSAKLYNDAANALLQTSMVERANVTLTAISSTLESWAREEERMAHSPDFYSTGEYFLGVLLQRHRAQTLSEKFFSHPLQMMNAGIVAALFIAVVLNLLGNVARLPCNFVLRMMKVAIGTFL